MTRAGSRACRNRMSHPALSVQKQSRQDSPLLALASRQPKCPGIHFPSHSPAAQTPLPSRTEPLLDANPRTVLLFAYMNSSGIKSDRSDDCQLTGTSGCRLRLSAGPRYTAKRSAEDSGHAPSPPVLYSYMSERSALGSIRVLGEVSAPIRHRLLFPRDYQGFRGAGRRPTRLPSQSG